MKLNVHILNQCWFFYPIFKTRLASDIKSARLVPMRERQNTAMSTEPSLSGTCTEKTCFIYNKHRGRALINKNYKAHTHVGHVTHSDELTGCCQVEAVHFVLHTSCYFTVTTTEVCDHQRWRPEVNDRCVYNNRLLSWKEHFWHLHRTNADLKPIWQITKGTVDANKAIFSQQVTSNN